MEGKQIFIVPHIKFCESLGVFRLQSWECNYEQRLSQSIVDEFNRVQRDQGHSTISNFCGSVRRGQSMQIIHTRKITVVLVQRWNKASKAKGWVWVAYCSLGLLQTDVWHKHHVNSPIFKQSKKLISIMQWKVTNTMAMLQEGISGDQTAWRQGQNKWRTTRTCCTLALIHPHYQCWLLDV